jgi:hypothetical protein
MKRGSRESSARVRRSVRTAWLSALSETMTSVPAVDRFVTALDQQDEQIEIAGDERHLAVFAQEEPAPRREREITEAVSNHNR